MCEDPEERLILPAGTRVCGGGEEEEEGKKSIDRSCAGKNVFQCISLDLREIYEFSQSFFILSSFSLLPLKMSVLLSE